MNYDNKLAPSAAAAANELCAAACQSLTARPDDWPPRRRLNHVGAAPELEAQVEPLVRAAAARQLVATKCTVCRAQSSLRPAKFGRARTHTHTHTHTKLHAAI